MKKEKFLRVDPSGAIVKVELPRKWDMQTNYCYLDFDSVRGFLQCSCVEVVRSHLHPKLVMFVDECGACDPVRPVNEKASLFYAGHLDGHMIHGPVIFAYCCDSPDYPGVDDYVPLYPRLERAVVRVLNF